MKSSVATWYLCVKLMATWHTLVSGGQLDKSPGKEIQVPHCFLSLSFFIIVSCVFLQECISFKFSGFYYRNFTFIWHSNWSYFDKICISVRWLMCSWNLTCCYIFFIFLKFALLAYEGNIKCTIVSFWIYSFRTNKYPFRIQNVPKNMLFYLIWYVCMRM